MEYQRRPGLEQDPEVHLNMANRFRAYFGSHRELKIQEPGLKINLNGGRIYRFPHNAIDYDSLVVIDHVGDFTLESFHEESWTSALVFRDPQPQPISLRPYRRLSSLFLSQAQDFPGDFMDSFQYEADEDFLPSPVALPFFDFERAQMETLEYIDHYSIPGSIVLHVPPHDKGMAALENELEKYRRLLSEDKTGLARQGIKDLRIDDAVISSFAAYTEGSIYLRCVIALDPQEDRYWHMPY